MLVQTVRCDRCQAIIEADRSRFKLETGPLLARGVEALDLCRSCLENLTRWLETSTPGPADSEAELSGSDPWRPGPSVCDNPGTSNHRERR